jgi:hypothetical protein
MFHFISGAIIMHREKLMELHIKSDIDASRFCLAPVKSVQKDTKSNQKCLILSAIRLSDLVEDVNAEKTSQATATNLKAFLCKNSNKIQSEKKVNKFSSARNQ